MKTFVLILILSAFFTVSRASQDRALPFTSIRFEANEPKGPGKIVVDAVQEEHAGIVSLRITAFAKEIIVPKDKLASLSNLRLHGVRVVHSDGLFGSSIWIAFQVGAPSLSDSEALVKVSPDGSIEIFHLESKKA